VAEAHRRIRWHAEGNLRDSPGEHRRHHRRGQASLRDRWPWLPRSCRESDQGLSAGFKETGRPRTSALPGVSGASREAAVGLPGITADGDGAANRFRSVTPRVEQQRPVVAEASHVSRRKVERRDRDRRKPGNISRSIMRRPLHSALAVFSYSGLHAALEVFEIPGR
jgi:hypothetical protein